MSLDLIETSSNLNLIETSSVRKSSAKKSESAESAELVESSSNKINSIETSSNQSVSNELLFPLLYAEPKYSEKEKKELEEKLRKKRMYENSNNNFKFENRQNYCLSNLSNGELNSFTLEQFIEVMSHLYPVEENFDDILMDKQHSNKKVRRNPEYLLCDYDRNMWIAVLKTMNSEKISVFGNIIKPDFFVVDYASDNNLKIYIQQFISDFNETPKSIDMESCNLLNDSIKPTELDNCNILNSLNPNENPNPNDPVKVKKIMDLVGIFENQLTSFNHNSNEILKFVKLVRELSQPEFYMIFNELYNLLEAYDYFNKFSDPNHSKFTCFDVKSLNEFNAHCVNLKCSIGDKYANKFNNGDYEFFKEFKEEFSEFFNAFGYDF